MPLSIVVCVDVTNDQTQEPIELCFDKFVVDDEMTPEQVNEQVNAMGEQIARDIRWLIAAAKANGQTPHTPIELRTAFNPVDLQPGMRRDRSGPRRGRGTVPGGSSNQP